MKTTATAKWRYALFAAIFAMIVVADYMVLPHVGNEITKGGYGHGKTGLDENDPDYAVRLGPRRVALNFRHFFHWWTWPAHNGFSWKRFLFSDGNSLTHNLVGHLLGSFILSLTGIALLPKPWIIFFSGTSLNIFHEYIAEGQYVDPSCVDLWFDQTGLALAILVFTLLHETQKRRKETR